MLFDAAVFSNLTHAIFLVLDLAALIVAIRFASWSSLFSVTAHQHVLFGGLFGCLMLWLLKVQVIDGVTIHLLGITALTLVVGWCFTVAGGVLLVTGHTLLVGESPLAVPVAFFFTVLVPASPTRVLVHFLRGTGVQNLFIYMLGAGFVGAVMSVAVIAGMAVALLWVSAYPDWVDSALANSALILPLMFAEGFINGMVVSALTVFYPDLMKTFDDRFYIDGER